MFKGWLRPTLANPILANPFLPSCLASPFFCVLLWLVLVWESVLNCLFLLVCCVCFCVVCVCVCVSVPSAGPPPPDPPPPDRPKFCSFFPPLPPQNSTREPKRAHLSDLALQTPPKIPRTGPTREGEKNKCGGEEGPTFGAP